MGLYAAIGGAGVGWFAGWNGGLSSLTGATGGYILGFVVAAFAIGWLTDRYVSVRSFFPLLVLMLIGVGIIYLFGAVWLSIVLGTSLTKTLSLAVLPFIPLDLAKAAAVAGVAYALLPKAAYNGEVDSVRYLGRRF
jgi:biotin transport system substrate-specific component